LRGDAISPLGSTLVQIWFVFPTRRIKVPYSRNWADLSGPIAVIDNDGSAEIVVVSDSGYNGQTAPTVQVIRDIEDRWIQPRRIWNQHTYHITNVMRSSLNTPCAALYWTMCTFGQAI
jgi:hypothetical protein